MRARITYIAADDHPDWSSVLEKAVRRIGTLRVEKEGDIDVGSLASKSTMVIIDALIIEARFLVARFLGQSPTLKIIVAGDSANFEEVRGFLLTGASNYIDKEHKPEELASKLQEVLGQKVLAPPWKGPPILLADNDIGFLRSQYARFEKRGYTVLPAANSKEARAVLSRWGVALAILDKRLDCDDSPDDVSGIEVARECAPGTPKVVLTRFANGETARQALLARMKGERAIIDVVEKKGDNAFFQEIERIAGLDSPQLHAEMSARHQYFRFAAVAGLTGTVLLGLIGVYLEDVSWLLGSVVFTMITIVFGSMLVN